ncbi:hypothetical protein [Serratia sp. Se-RSBMAAmG]|uniref:hypothetical protein n=1 Tax=Serratia sp. Se-RSBMAAmG TaxID=3043305 RepID=UPI0024AFA081|nr:hypothetical protein [Serratia sp. Se-RSBMAAmG]MDI6977255.1 hypothetical protein [Serratia sp. Se-RSBMAAmG]
MKNKELIGRMVMAISQSAADRKFFLNGGCSKLVEYFIPFIKKDETIKLAVFIYFRSLQEQSALRKTLSESQEEDLLRKIEGFDILIDHIALFDDGMIYDAHGITTKEIYQREIMLNNNFMEVMEFKLDGYLDAFMKAVCGSHIHGKTSKKVIQNKVGRAVNRWMEQSAQVEDFTV